MPIETHSSFQDERCNEAFADLTAMSSSSDSSSSSSEEEKKKKKKDKKKDKKKSKKKEKKKGKKKDKKKKDSHIHQSPSSRLNLIFALRTLAPGEKGKGPLFQERPREGALGSTTAAHGH